MDDDDFDALYLDLMKEFLATATPLQWLAVVTTMNYDNGSALPDWISKHPKLEPAVARPCTGISSRATSSTMLRRTRYPASTAQAGPACRR